MNENVEKMLDSNSELQILITSREWQADSMGIFVNQAVKFCIAAGATEGEAYEYLELS